jgi:2-keto-4-pentenoate hydratase/2-oxohepta-3-ene-1,7-dioic acid hydratase in catechol pathway
MNIVRIQTGDTSAFAIASGDGTVTICDGSPFDSLTLTTDVRKLTDLTVLAPVVPGKIVGVGLNYRGHAAEHGLPLPAQPLIFFKPVSAVVGPQEPILVAEPSRRTDLEAELVVVIGKRARNVPEAEAVAYVLGYMCGNDVSERDAQREDNGWPGRSKGFDTFAPIGPSIQTDLAPSARIQARINDRLVQDSTIEDLIFPVPSLVSFVSSVVTLEPGDLIFTGTPAGVSPIRPGDVVSVSIEGIGSLDNPVELRPERAS